MNFRGLCKSSIVEKDYWGELWREYQNNFFKEHGLDISVDLNHVIAERHAGRKNHSQKNYLHQENELIEEARTELILNPEVLIEHITKTHSVFTRKDIERLVFKTYQKTHKPMDYLNVVAKILEHQTLVPLGFNDQGIESFTTRQQYIAEGKLLSHVEQLCIRKNHALPKPIDGVIEQYSLNEEQTEALHYITQGNDISVLVGRPGVGKSYLLKPLKNLYEEQGFIVLGASLSGKVAKALEAETNIQASTIASLAYRLKTGRLLLTNKHVLIIDEAGMVDFDNLSYLLQEVDEKGAKIILVGDPDQLKPIHKGEIFRGIAARTGYIELGNIKRQQDVGDRKASLDLACGYIEKAINHYAQKEAIHFFNGQNETTDALIHAWQQNLTAKSIKQHALLAFTRAAVEELNLKARRAAIEKGLLSPNGFDYCSQNGTKTLSLSQGERILFRQNNKDLGVRNGDLATITQINAKTLTATLDSGEQVIIPKNYKWIDYGYALTVHKSQGMTVEKTSVLIDSTYWDKHLAFVAMTRHKEQLQIYANTDIHANFHELTKNLSRSTIKDNVIDYPLDYALRAGFDSDSVIGKAIDYLAQARTSIKDKWNYIVNYETYLQVQDIKTQCAERQKRRSVAGTLATLLDESQDLTKHLKALDEKAKQKGLNPYQLPDFAMLYARSLERDKKAATLLYQAEFIENKIPSSQKLEKIKSYSERYTRYQTIEGIAKSSPGDAGWLNNKNSLKINVTKDYAHIVHLASQHHTTSDALCKKIILFQNHYRQQAWVNLCKQHPLLGEYDLLTQQAAKTQGYRKEQYQKMIQSMAMRITKDSLLLKQLKQEHPLKATKLLAQIHSQSHERSY